MNNNSLLPMNWEGIDWSSALHFPSNNAPKIDFITTDSRNVPANSLFVALVGERFDGHDFIDQAIKNGAVAVIANRNLISSKLKNKFNETFFILVDDTLVSLGDLASAWVVRHSVQKVGITGSSGKTTTKDLSALVLERKGKVLATKGNFNNLIGVPLTLFDLRNEDFAIVELGTNSKGEIARLAEIASPNVALITGIHPAHLRGFGSVEDVLSEKFSLFEYVLSNNGKILFNTDDDLLYSKLEYLKSKSAHIITYSASKSDADLFADNINLFEDGCEFVVVHKDERANIYLPIPGAHSISNALAAISVGIAFGVSISDAASAVSEFRPTKGRMCIRKDFDGITVIDDSYNANPASMKAALSVLSLHKGRKIAVLGDMLELGDQSLQLHYDIGKIAAQSVDALFLFGDYSRFVADAAKNLGLKYVFHFLDIDELINKLSEFVRPKDVVLFKGSRGMAIERAMAAIERFRILDEGEK